MISPWIGIALVLGALGGMVLGLHGARGRFQFHPELVRKLLHIGMGLVTLSFPWVFRENWPVVALAGLAIAALLGVKLIGGLREGLGKVVHGVGRDSLGEIYFPAAVATVFVLAQGDAVLYSIPILVLTLADAVAALIGVRYGQLHYTAGEGERKSWEGSIAFFTVAFLSTHIPLLLFTELGRAETLLIALTLGVLVAGLEAVAWRGLDNLFIPLGTLVLLQVYRDLTVTDLVLRFGVIVGLMLFTAWWRKRTTLSDAGALSAGMVGYVFWGIGGWPWLVPPLLLLLVYPRLVKLKLIGNVHGPQAILSVTAGGLLWVFLAKTLRMPELYYPYALSFAIQLAITVSLTLIQRRRRLPRVSALAIGVSQGALLMLAWWWHEGFHLTALMQAGLAILLVAAGAFAFTRLQPELPDCPADGPRWLRQGAIGFVGSLLGLLPLIVLR